MHEVLINKPQSTPKQIFERAKDLARKENRSIACGQLCSIDVRIYEHVPLKERKNRKSKIPMTALDAFDAS